MERVVSKDGTAIAFDRLGKGPAVILVAGAFGSRTFGPNVALVSYLAEHFTVIQYDRRGRGDSGDTLPFDIQREVEDIDALIDAAGGSASVYGISSGGALALEAATRGLPIDKLALFELPFVVDATRQPIPSTFSVDLAALVSADRRDDAIKYFMKTVGVPSFVVALMKFMPAWSHLRTVAHTAAYDAASLGENGSGNPLRAEQWATVKSQTLVMGGGKSPAWTRNAMVALAEAIPTARHLTLKGQSHIVSPKALAPVLIEFFGS